MVQEGQPHQQQRLHGRMTGRRTNHYQDYDDPRHSWGQPGYLPKPFHASEPTQPHQQEEAWLSSSDTFVHFHKSFGVMQEIFDHRDFSSLSLELRRCAASAAPPGVEPMPQFLDLGCAPGGFSACLLQDNILGPNTTGYGVTLPPQLGGFTMMCASERLCIQMGDILGLNTNDLLCQNNSIDLCVADAQNLSSLSKQRNNKTPQYRGLRVRSRALGIWALTVKECQLAFSKLRNHGSFIFRFGWRGVGTDVHPTGEKVSPTLLEKYLEEEEWYKALTHWLFSVLKSLFATLKPFKSEYVHQADVSFYMVCSGFDRNKYERHDWEAKLARAFQELSDCDDEAALVAGIKDGITESVKAEIDDLLELVGRMRAIGIQSRKVTNPRALGVKPDSSEDAEQSTASQSRSGDTASGGADGRYPAASPNSAEQGGASASSASQASDTSINAPVPDHDAQPFQEELSAMEQRPARPRRIRPAGKGVGKGQTQDSRAQVQTQAGNAGANATSKGASKTYRTDQDGQQQDARPIGKGEHKMARKRVWPTKPHAENQVFSKGGVVPPPPPPLPPPPPPPPPPTWSSTASLGYPMDQSLPEATFPDAPELHHAIDADEAYRRQMHVSMFQSQLHEWQQVEGARRMQEEEQAAAEHARRALHVQSFHSQLHHQGAQMVQLGHTNNVDASGIRLMPVVSPDWAVQSPGASVDGVGWMPTMPTKPPISTSPSAFGTVAPDATTNSPGTWAATSNLSWSASSKPGAQAEMPVTSSSSPTPPTSSPPPSTQLNPTAGPASTAPSSSTPSSTNQASASDGGKPPVARSRPTSYSENSRGTWPIVVTSRKKADQSHSTESRETEQAADSESGSSSEEGKSDKRRKYRHKARAGRSVRERRMNRTKRRDYLVDALNGPKEVWELLRAGSWPAKAIDALYNLILDLHHGGFFLHAARFGLFCAMAWSMNSIIFSMLHIYKGESPPNGSSKGG